MAVTKVDNQRLSFKKKIEKFNDLTKACYHQKGSCPVRDVLAPTVDKWSLFCLYYLAYLEVMRFNKLKKVIPGISSRMLSITLKRLEDGKLIKRKVYAEVPPRVEYSLTKFGSQYAERLLELNLWLFEENAKVNKRLVKN